MARASTAAAKGAPRRPLRDAERTQAAILSAATQEFARHGLGGARVDRIAARAKTNKRMLYYYFGRKDALFLAVLENTYASIRNAEKTLSMLDVAPAEGIRRLIRFTWDYYLAHPEFLSLLNTENLHDAKHLRRSRYRVQMKRSRASLRRYAVWMHRSALRNAM
jgi:AcrR family transcriptional regulator